MSLEIKLTLFLLGIQMFLYIGVGYFGYQTVMELMVKRKGGNPEDPLDRILNNK